MLVQSKHCSTNTFPIGRTLVDIIFSLPLPCCVHSLVVCLVFSAVHRGKPLEVLEIIDCVKYSAPLLTTLVMLQASASL